MTRYVQVVVSVREVTENDQVVKGTEYFDQATTSVKDWYSDAKRAAQFVAYEDDVDALLTRFAQNQAMRYDDQ